MLLYYVLINSNSIEHLRASLPNSQAGCDSEGHQICPFLDMLGRFIPKRHSKFIFGKFQIFRPQSAFEVFENFGQNYFFTISKSIILCWQHFYIGF